MRSLNQTPLKQQPTFNLFKTEEVPAFRSTEEYIAHNQQDVAQCANMMEKLISLQPELTKKNDQILEEVDGKEYSKGIGYFNCKNMLMMEYLIQLQFYQLFKINGEDLTTGQGLQLYKRLVYLKTLITKLTPVEKKLEYQKNKLLKYSDVVNVKADKQVAKQGSDIEESEEQSEENELMPQEDLDQEDEEDQQLGEAEEGNHQSEEEDVLMYQPRPQELLKVKKAKKTEAEIEGKYVAPKISAVLSKEDRKKQKDVLQDQRRKAYLIRRYRDDLQDDQEARETGLGSQLSEKIKKKFQQKIAVEEDNFMRFPQQKREKMWKKNMIKRYQRSNPLIDELKDIEMVKEIFTERKEEPLSSKIPKRQKAEHKPKKGSKKRKIE